MAESSTSLSITAIQTQVVTYTGLSEANALVHVQNAVREFLGAFNWSFLEPTATLSIVSGDATTALPDDFAEMIQPPAFAAGTGYRSIELVSLAELLQMRANSDDASTPMFCAVEPITFTASTGQRWQLRWYPKADAAYTVTYKYRVLTGMPATTNYIPGGAEYGPVVLYLALGDYDLTRGEAKGNRFERGQMELAKAIQRDQRNRSGAVLGTMTPTRRIDYVEINPITEV